MNKTHAAPERESLNLKVSAPMYRGLKTIADKHDRSISYVAKQLIAEGLKKAGVKL